MAGFEYTEGTDEVRPRATWFITPQTVKYPSVVLGTSADRLSSGSGQLVFLTMAKMLPKTTVTVFGSLKYASELDRVGFPFGMNIAFPPSTTLQTVYDGNYTHILLSHTVGSQTFTLMLARAKHPGIQISFSF